MAQPKAARAAAVPPTMPEPDIAAELHALASSSLAAAAAGAEGRRRTAPLVVIGHRGKGMNALAAEADPRLRGDVRENTLRSLNDAAASHRDVAYVEFDVQVRDATVSTFFSPVARHGRRRRPPLTMPVLSRRWI
jgi:hypothetical protein